MDTSDAIKVRYEGYEILVDPDLAKEAKLEGKDHDIQRLLFVQEVFEDAGEGKRASAEELEEEFDTRQILKAAEEIFEKGDMQLTTEQKDELRQEKYRQVVNMIARRVQNPKTGNPHPPQRVENALEEAGFNADAFQDVEEQFQDAIDMIRPIIPVSLDEKTVVLQIPNDEAGKAYDKIQAQAEVNEEEWGSEYFYAEITMPAGAFSELLEELQELTSGKVQVKEK